MVNNSKIAATAIRVTLNNPLLWFFGIFLAGGFNFNWLFLSRSGFAHNGGRWAIRFWHFSLGDPDKFFWQWLGFFGILLVIWVLVNWIKVAFIFNAADIMKMERLGKNQDEGFTIWEQQRVLFSQGWKVLPSVLAVSFFVTVTQGIVTSVLSAPLFWQRYIAPVPAMVVLATALFVIFMFLFSLLNFFAALYASLYQQKFHPALAHAIKLISTRFKELFIFCVLLLALYVAGVIIGLEAANGARAVFSQLNYGFDTMDLWRGYSSSRLDIVGVIFLVWLGFLNSVFNVGLCIFFRRFVQPTKYESEQEKAAAVLKVSVDKSV